MLETLVAPRIRRTLFEYILAHPHQRFYLRGLAKELALPISPLRRELKRLEGSGMLTSAHEGNILFYTVNATAPAFLQLQQAVTPLRDTQVVRVPLPRVETAQSSVVTAVAPELSPTVEGSIAVSLKMPWWKSPLSSPMLVGAAAVGMTLIFIMAGLMYVTMTNQHLISQTTRALATRTAVATAAPSNASGTMHSSRWQIVPGGFGGFSSGSNSESF